MEEAERSAGDLAEQTVGGVEAVRAAPAAAKRTAGEAMACLVMAQAATSTGSASFA